MDKDKIYLKWVTSNLFKMDYLKYSLRKYNNSPDDCVVGCG